MAFSTGDPWEYTPPLSLWKLVEQNVSPKEQDEIRSMLGTSLIDTTLELHSEVDMLLEIWRDYRDETESESDCQSTSKLAEPPHVRERLVQEICFLAESVREKSVRKGMNPSALFSKHNSDILDYAEETKRSGSSLGTARPQSARSSDGRQTPLSPSEQASSRSALSSTINEDVAAASDKLNYMQFDQVCIKLRETLTKEIEQLEADVVFLQGCLDNAADMRSCGSTPALSREPTITELREERSMLEKELLSTQGLPSTPPVTKPAFLPNSAGASVKMQSLGPINTRLRPAHTSASTGSSKTAPLKASHHITNSVPSPDSGSASPDSIAASSDGFSSPTNQSANRTITRRNYDLNTNVAAEGSSEMSHRVSHSSQERDHRAIERDGNIRRHEGSGGRRRMLSPARVKVVPVGSILDPQANLVSGPPFMPTPPPAAEKPQLPRPSSAERFRKMVMHYREAT